MATHRSSTVILANTRVNIDLGPLNAPVGPQGGRARLFASGSAVGLLMSLGAGTRFPISNAVPNIRAVAGATLLRNEDGIGEVIAGPLSTFTMTVENTTGGDLTASLLIDIDGIPGT